MNKILNINLGGYALTIDDDAYEYLQAYLESIRRRFRESDGRDEILSDIEARLGELISQSMGNRTIVMLPDVEAAIEIMGKPEDFGGESTETNTTNTTGKSQSRTNTATGPTVKTGKRLFRDEEDAVVSGVCSGLSAYFGISDPVWMRLIFVLLVFLSFGFWMPAYILLWILVPPAKSAADRLAMRGEQINVDNIAREIEDGFERLSNRVNDFGNKQGTPGQNALNSSVSAIGQLFGGLIRLIGKFAALIAILIAGSLFLAMAAGWIGSIWGVIMAAPYFEYFSPYSNGVTWLGFANLFFILGIPLTGLALMFSRALFKVRTPAWLNTGLTLFWIVNLISGIFLIGFAAKEYRSTGSVNSNIELGGMNSDTLFVRGFELSPNEFDHTIGFDEEGIRIGENKLEINGPLEIRIFRSQSNQFKCTQIVKAQGPTNLKAQENAAQATFAVNVTGNTISVPTAYSIPKGTKWRVQRIRLNIEVPDGKSIVFDDKIYHFAGADLDEYSDDTDRNYISRSPNQVFQMRADGLVCTTCPGFGDRGYRSDRNYERFVMEGNFNAEIREGNNFRVEIIGSAADRNAIKTFRSNDQITFSTDGKNLGSDVRIMIETPVFTSLHSENIGEVIIRGFKEGEASISARGTGRIRGYFDVSNQLSVVLSGNCSAELNGEGGDIEASLNNGAKLDAANWRAQDADISASDASRARVFARNNATVIADGNSEVKVDGGASVKNNRE
jgi:phage shock protein PspC (stress-responsive transcriptional regulator)/uncharacterized membrane protein